ncbi:MAG: GDP-mannose 4,6-dehydratase [Chloroflexi bacterium]|nr:GDP-mannose 4,6-dehydratase [Chloroflexota bacterium]
MHVIVTGGAGFIGSNVAAAFLREGHRVTVFDSLLRPGSERNLEWLQAQPDADRLRFVRGDTRDADLVRSVIGDAGVHIVFHFAAQTAVTTSLTAPREDLEVNIVGTHNVLEAVRQSRAGIPPMLFFTSTNKVYGSLPHRPAVESSTRYRFADAQADTYGINEHEPLDFHSPYGCSKGAADQYVHDYARIYGLRTVVFRMSCIYGPRQFGTEDQGWVAHFMLAVAEGRPLTIYGNGKQVRDLLFIDDLVRAFKLAVHHIDTAAGHVYNVGGGPANTISIWQELRPRLENLSGRRLKITSQEWRPGDQPVYVSDIRQAHRDFGWQPQVGIDEGLRRLWSWAVSLSAARQTTAAETQPTPVPLRRLPLPHAADVNVALASPSA